MTGAQHDHFPADPPPLPTAWQALTAAQRREQVRQAVQQDGLTYAHAAARLGCSRTAVAGVIERSKRTPTPIVSSSGQSNGAIKNRRPNGAKPPRKAKPRHAGFHKFVALPELPKADYAPPRADAWLPLPNSTPVPIADHTTGCRWPCGAELPFSYCNETVKADSVYCSRHSALAFRELPARRDIRKDTP